MIDLSTTTPDFKWLPCSTYAYGGNAVYIPEYGAGRALEFILMMNQNYPEFKTHPALDIYHGYTQGMERFEHNHDYRVVPWQLDAEYRYWSYLYLPTFDNDIRAIATFVPARDKSMRLIIELENPGKIDREWEFFMYISPNEGYQLPDCDYMIMPKDNFRFKIEGMNFELKSQNVLFSEVTETDSNFWINFPLNAEMTCQSEGWRKRGKKRLKLNMSPVEIPAGSKMVINIDFYPEKFSGSDSRPSLPEKELTPDAELPYRHHQWQMLHNIQYIESFHNPARYVVRMLPARQWGRFFIWDMGMAAVGAAEFNIGLAESIIQEMPDPVKDGESIYEYGSYIITAVYALWELVRITGSTEYAEKYFSRFYRLAIKMFDPIGGAPVISGCGADDSPALFYAKGWIFNWEFKKTLPTNPERETKKMYCTGLAAHGIRILKILRDLACLIERDDDIDELNAWIQVTENFLTEHHWNEKDSCFYDVMTEDGSQLEIPWIYDFLPLFSNSVPEVQRKAQFDKLMEKYFIPERGFCIVPPDSEYYRNEGYPNGSTWPPLQYIFWKTCYAMGEMATAEMVAETWLKLWENNHRDSLGNWEQFRLDTGLPAGNFRFAGFTSPILTIHAARRVFGTVQTAFDILIIDRNIAPEHTELTLIAISYSGLTGVSIVLKPDAEYLLVLPGEEQSLHSDKNGCLAFVLQVAAGKELHIILKEVTA
jgi:Mannosylglycerate hydrolase MGH1-like glycoside hydrolase domain